jgi:hypothetical protein
MWEAVATNNYTTQATSHTYRCAFCGVETTDDVILERLLKKIKLMKDGQEATVGDLLAPEKYGYSELSHISMLLSQKVRGEGISLDTGSGASSFVQYYETFKKRSKKRIVIRKVGKKSGYRYKDGDLVVETIDLNVFGKANVEASFVFCCEQKTQTQHTASVTYDMQGGVAYGDTLADWITRVKTTNQQYEFTGNVVDQMHYGKTIVTINDVNFLMDSEDTLIKELEAFICFDDYRQKMIDERNTYIGYDYDNPPSKKKKCGLFGFGASDDGKEIKNNGSHIGGSVLSELWKKLNQPIGKK